MPRFDIDFMKLKKVFFILSAILLLVSAGSLIVRGLQLGVEFRGGSVITVTDGQGQQISAVRKAFENAGFKDVTVQTSKTADKDGFLIKTTIANADTANKYVKTVARALNMETSNFSVSTVGAGWGKKLTNSAFVALFVSLLAILIYISIRFEYKMSVMAIVALIHDVIITLGIYSLIGAEVTTSTIAAVLTVLGYSLYDTIVVFGRIKENANGSIKSSFSDMANVSINEVFGRSVNTTITSLIPVVTMLCFKVEALNGFAIALTIGLAVGAYSSIGVAAPLYAMWKETEPRYATLRKKYGVGQDARELVAESLHAEKDVPAAKTAKSAKTASKKGTGGNASKKGGKKGKRK